MAIISKQKLGKQLEVDAMRELLKEIKRVYSSGDLVRFLNTLFTKAEKNTVLRRISAAILLSGGKNYREIKDELKISRATISNIQDIISVLGYGRNPGRKRIYSGSIYIGTKTKRKNPIPRYKGAPSIF